MSQKVEIQETISSFMNSFDLKDWTRMKEVLADMILVDYSDLRGDEIQQISANQYIAMRVELHEKLHLHHLITNFEVDVGGRSATVLASCLIFRRSGSEEFNTHALYEFGLLLDENDNWKINRIKQVVLWSQGDLEIDW
jgi:hypothetical protein